MSFTTFMQELALEAGCNRGSELPVPSFPARSVRDRQATNLRRSLSLLLPGCSSIVSALICSPNLLHFHPSCEACERRQTIHDDRGVQQRCERDPARRKGHNRRCIRYYPILHLPWRTVRYTMATYPSVQLGRCDGYKRHGRTNKTT